MNCTDSTVSDVALSELIAKYHARRTRASYRNGSPLASDVRHAFSIPSTSSNGLKTSTSCLANPLTNDRHGSGKFY